MGPVSEASAEAAIISEMYSAAFCANMIRRGDYLYLWFSRPGGSDVVKMKVTVNLKTGRAVCGPGWSDYFSRVPKSFISF